MTAEDAAIMAMVLPMVAGMAHLGPEQRMALLMSLLCQEMCLLPPGERPEALEGVLDDLPGIMRATESGMREALVENARRGL